MIGADGGEVGGGLAVEQAEVAEVGAWERLQAGGFDLLEERLQAVPVLLAEFDPAVGKHKGRCPLSVLSCQFLVVSGEEVGMSFTDQLNIETPEQVELRFPIAGLGSRFVAILADTALQLGAVILLIFLLYLFGKAESAHQTAHLSSSGEKWAIAVVVLFFFLLFWGYFSLFEGLWHGQTPGKRAMKIRVIKDSGRQITLFEAMARNLLRVVDMQFSYLVGVVSMLCTKEQKRLGDLVAGTIVVHERSEEQPLLTHNRTITQASYQEPVPRAARRPESEPLAADAVARLERADLHVIETFFGRALDLTVQTREEMAARIAARMAGKMGIEVPDASRPERFLEAVAFEMRAQGRG
jgi:uncharacterized RDD family membrane protein YckC